MVNHIKTLLANKDAGSATASGLSFYVDPSFSPVVTDDRTEAIRKELVEQSASMESVLKAVYSVVSRVDMREHLERYDTRVDPPDKNIVPVFAGFNPDEDRVSFDVFYKKDVASYLFSRTRNESTDEELALLKSLWLSDVDGHTGLAACILALVARLDLAFNRKR